MFGTGGKSFLWIIRATSFSLPLMARGHQFSDNRINCISSLSPSLQLWESGTINKLSICRRLQSSPLLFLALYPRACLSFFPPRLQFLRLSLTFGSVMWVLQRVGKSCSPFENREGSRARGRRVKCGTSYLVANFAHRLDIMTAFGDFPPFRRAS